MIDINKLIRLSRPLFPTHLRWTHAMRVSHYMLKTLLVRPLELVVVLKWAVLARSTPGWPFIINLFIDLPVCLPSCPLVSVQPCPRSSIRLLSSSPPMHSSASSLKHPYFSCPPVPASCATVDLPHTSSRPPVLPVRLPAQFSSGRVGSSVWSVVCLPSLAFLFVV